MAEAATETASMLARPAAARRGGVSAHGHPAVRRAREIHPCARCGDGRPTSRSCWWRRRAPTPTIRKPTISTRSAPWRRCCSCSSSPTARSRCWSRALRARGDRRLFRAQGALRHRGRARAAVSTATSASSRRLAFAALAVRAVREDESQGAAGTVDDAVGHRRCRAAWPTPSRRTLSHPLADKQKVLESRRRRCEAPEKC
jgi:hypothetical protein